MSELARIGVAISDDLLERFDALIEQRGYTNRSEAFRDLVRSELVKEVAASPDAEVCGTITIIYDHHTRLLPEKLTELQHHYYAAILSTVHVHLDHDQCMEVILVRGKASVVRKLAGLLIAQKGVTHGDFTIAVSGSSPA